MNAIEAGERKAKSLARMEQRAPPPPNSLSGEQEIAKLRRIFAQLDTDNSGALDYAECTALLEKMGKHHLSERELDEAFAEMDADSK
eukprot:SAG31_NODE_3685_length_3989_cov_1.633419_3_plen_87_part_00